MSNLPPAFAFWGQGQVLGIDTPIVIMLVVFFAAYLLLNQYPSGRYIYGIGGNEEAVRLSGIHVRQYKLIAYTLSGLTAAVSGVVLCSRPCLVSRARASDSNSTPSLRSCLVAQPLPVDGGTSLERSSAR
jgi:ribose/xylose/arabinose/galactoside ABC-type transport system permease subunit